MAKIKTDASAKGARPDPSRQVDYRVEGLRGLALRVTPRGNEDLDAAIQECSRGAAAPNDRDVSRSWLCRCAHSSSRDPG